jgi:Prokaryotic metallothionein
VPHQTCAHCGVEIGDHSTMVERDGKAFCCNNCAAFATGQTAQAAMGTCAHCHSPIVDPSTRVERNGEMFCCPNCAAAMPAGAGHRQH